MSSLGMGKQPAYTARMVNPTNTSEQPKKLEKNSWVARFLVANAFSAIGAKLAIFGAVADLNKIVGPELTIGEKFKTVFSKEIIQKFKDRAQYLVVHEGMSPFKATFMATKWSYIVGTVAGTATFVLGWVRGGLIDDWKDIGKHPIRSTKIVLGLEKLPAQKIEAVTPTLAPFIAEEPKAVTAKWTDKVPPSALHADAVTQQKTAESGAYIG